MVLMVTAEQHLSVYGTLGTRLPLPEWTSLGGVGFTIIISNYFEYYRLTCVSAVHQGDDQGRPGHQQPPRSSISTRAWGGILEYFGRLFRNAVKLYVYVRKDA